MWKTTLTTGKWLLSTQPAAWICSLSQSIFQRPYLLQSLPDNVSFVTVFVGQWSTMFFTAAACWHRWVCSYLNSAQFKQAYLGFPCGQQAETGSSSHLRYLHCSSLEMSLTTQATPATNRNKELHSKLGKTDVVFRDQAAVEVLEGSGSDSNKHSIYQSLC